MKVHKIKSVYVCQNSEYFTIQIGFKHYNLGLQFPDFGIRIMLIWWHILIHY